MRYPSLFMLVAVALLALISCAAKLSPVVVILAPEEHTLSGADAQTHRIELAAGKSFLVNVEQLGIDVVVEARDPEGEIIVTVNTPSERVGFESLLLETANAGVYQLNIRSNEFADKQGRYRLSIDELNAKTRADQQRLKAEITMAEAASQNYKIASSSDSDAIKSLRSGAIDRYEQAAKTFSRLDIKDRSAWATLYMAWHHYELFEWRKAAEYAAEAARFFSDSEEPLVFASALQLQGMALIETHDKKDFETAIHVFSQALDLQRKGESLYDQANTLNYIGIAYFQQGDLASAREQFLIAGDMFNTLGEPQQAIWTLNNAASIDRRTGNYGNAIESFKKALSLPAASEFTRERAGILDNLADTYADMGRLQEALLAYRQAVELFDSTGDRPGKARSLRGIGVTYGRLGNWQRALGLFQQALALQQGPAENRTLVTTYIDIGNAQRKLGKPKQALQAHNKALQKAKLPAEKSLAYVELGRDYVAADKIETAIAQFDLALQNASGEEARASRALALQVRGQLMIEQDIDVAAGLSDLQQALDEHRALRSETGIAQTLQAMARAEQRLGRLAAARKHAEQALQAIETLRVRVGSPSLRRSFTGLQRPSYELHIALLMEMADAHVGGSQQKLDYTALALEVSERARARSLVELLSEANTEANQGIDEDLLLERQSKRQQLAGLAHRLEKLAAAGDPEAVQAESRLNSVQVDLDILDAKIRKQNFKYAELTQPEHLKAKDIQHLLQPPNGADTGTVLLEYSLGEQRSFLWCVSENSITSWNLPGRQEIESVALAVYNNFKTLDFDTQARRQTTQANTRLAEMILAPAAECWQGQRIVVVADGALQYIPFGALPIPKTGASPALLFEQHEVITLPSASTLAMLRRTETNRDTAERSVAIFADPVFGAEDARLTGILSAEQHASIRSPEALDASRLMRLPATGVEAEAIASLAEPAPLLKATGFAANRANVLNMPLNQYRLVHFATHGLINSQYPELSALALSAFDKNGEPQSSFLRLHDIYGLKLNAELVVLSACEAALGKDVRGEGLIGLTRGFMYAGTSRVVASLWRASDAATARLMEEFYKLMLKQNFEPPAALRAAQLTVSRDRRWRDPYYWAGFVLQGDWR